MYRKIPLPIFLVLIFFTQVQQQVIAQIPQTVPALIDSVERLMEKKKIPGLQLSLVKDDSVLYSGGLGYSNIERQEKVDKHSLFRMGSITKTLVSLAVLKLVREKKFTLDAQLSQIAEEVPFVNEWEATDPITIAHLLEHTAGFDDMRLNQLYNQEGKEIPMLERVNKDANSIRARWRPGTRHSYSNPGYVILGYLIEKFGKISFYDYVLQEVIWPIGMKDSNLLSFTNDSLNFVQGYKYDQEKEEFVEVPFYAINGTPAGALNASANDMTALIRFFINNGQVDTLQFYTQEEIDEMEKVHTTLAAANGLQSGYGLGNYTSNYEGNILFQGHNGGIDGFISAFAYNQEYKIGYALSNNGSNGMQDIVKLVKAFLLQNIPSPSLTKYEIEANSMAEYEGYYHFKSPRNELFTLIADMFNGVSVSIENDTLYYKGFMQDKKALIPTGEKVFRTEDANFSNTAFMENNQGSKVIQISNMYFEKKGFLSVFILRVIFFGVLLITLVSVVTFIAWLINWFKKKLTIGGLLIRIMPFLSLFCFVLSFIALQLLFLGEMVRFSNINGLTLTFYISLLLFTILSVTSLLMLLFKKEKLNTWLQRWLIVSAVFACSWAFVLFNYGFIGLKLWDY